jgi:hypothetical protein
MVGCLMMAISSFLKLIGRGNLFSGGVLTSGFCLVNRGAWLESSS